MNGQTLTLGVIGALALTSHLKKRTGELRLSPGRFTRELGSLSKKARKKKKAPRRGPVGIPSHKRKSIVRRARQIFDTQIGGCPKTMSRQGRGFCPHWTWAVIMAAQESGYPLRLQAGTASWTYVHPRLDDGVRPLNFTYYWEGLNSPAVRSALASNMLPEMHVWAKDPKSGDIIDLSTAYWPNIVEASMPGERWSAPKPPKFLWVHPRDLTTQARYKAHPDAAKVAAILLGNSGLVFPPHSLEGLR